MTKAYHSDNLVYCCVGIFDANKVIFTWFVTLILGLDASTFWWVKGACSVIRALKQGVPLTVVIG